MIEKFAHETHARFGCGCGTAAHTSATVADAAEALAGIRAHMGGDVPRPAGNGPAGPAVTTRLVRDDAASAAAAWLAAIRLVESTPRGSVLMMSLEGEKTWAAIGELRATCHGPRARGSHRRRRRSGRFAAARHWRCHVRVEPSRDLRVVNTAWMRSWSRSCAGEC
jgi:hypothetical protein